MKTIHTSLKRMIALAAMLFVLAMPALPAMAEEAEANRTGETQATVTFEAGQLKLTGVPALNFGTQKISHEQAEYAAVSVSPNIQVSDLRGNGDGWDLMVSLSAFELPGGEQTLKAASIQIKNPKVTAVNGTVGNAPAAVAEVVIESDGTETPVWKAAAGAGMGVWELTWNAADTKLVVLPGTAKEGSSAATLNWSLQATP